MNNSYTVNDSGIDFRLKEMLLELISSENFKIPMLPTIAQELISTIDNPHITFNKLADIIKKDAFIGAKLLKVANSPFYAGGFPVSKIEVALQRIGIEEVKKILFLITMSNFLIKKGRYSYLFKEFWEHSLLSAISGKAIAEMLKIDSSYAYIAGLLHDIGRTFVLIGVMELEKKFGSEKMPDEIIVRQVSFELHTKIGELIASRWNLPDLIKNSIVYHHSLEKARTNDISLITLASEKMLSFFDKSDEESMKDIAMEPAFYILGLTREQIEELKEKMPPLYEKALLIEV